MLRTAPINLSAALCPSHLQYVSTFIIAPPLPRLALPPPPPCRALAAAHLIPLPTPAPGQHADSLALFEWWHEDCKHLRRCTTACGSLIVSPQLKLIVMDRKEGTVMNLQPSVHSLNPQAQDKKCSQSVGLSDSFFRVCTKGSYECYPPSTPPHPRPLAPRFFFSGSFPGNRWDSKRLTSSTITTNCRLHFDCCS